MRSSLDQVVGKSCPQHRASTSGTGKLVAFYPPSWRVSGVRSDSRLLVAQASDTADLTAGRGLVILPSGEGAFVIWQAGHAQQFVDSGAVAQQDARTLREIYRWGECYRDCLDGVTLMSSNEVDGFPEEPRALLTLLETYRKMGSHAEAGHQKVARECEHSSGRAEHFMSTRSWRRFWKKQPWWTS